MNDSCPARKRALHPVAAPDEPMALRRSFADQQLANPTDQQAYLKPYNLSRIFHSPRIMPVPAPPPNQIQSPPRRTSPDLRAGTYGAPIFTLGNTATSYVATGLQTRATYFFVFTAYDPQETHVPFGRMAAKAASSRGNNDLEGPAGLILSDPVGVIRLRAQSSSFPPLTRSLPDLYNLPCYEDRVMSPEVRAYEQGSLR